MAKQSVQYNGGIGFGGLLTIVFLVLKLTGVIAWSWWWIFAPIWIPVSVGLIFGLLLVITGTYIAWKRKLL